MDDSGRVADDLDRLATYFVESGRLVPGISVDAHGMARSWWWPLPSSADHQLLEAICPDQLVESQITTSRRLAESVDRVARERLVDAGVELVARRGGRRTGLEDWLLSLTEVDPGLSAKLSDHQVDDLVREVEAWVRSGASTMTAAGLVVRLSEPPPRSAAWTLELLARNEADHSLLLPVAQVWTREDQLDWLESMGRVVAVAPELAKTLASSEPQAIEVDSDTALTFVAERTVPLTELGVSVQLPSWWSSRKRPSLRAKTSSRSTAQPGSAGNAGFGLDDVVSFRWEAALGERRLSAADLRALEKAADNKERLVKLRGDWVEFDPAELDAILSHVGETGQATAGEILRTGLGLDGIAPPNGVPVGGVAASGWLAELLDDAAHSKISPIETPEVFTGELRPYQERGVGWLSFLGRLGLGSCLADDMGLGKTAQMIATYLVDSEPGPMLVVCPVSVIANWANEISRFAPHLRVLLHHGARRFDFDDRFDARVAEHDVVLTSYSIVARDLEQLQSVGWRYLVLDEAQQIKNPSTAQARAVRAIDAQRRVAMTGTPVENRLSELWSIMQFLNPGLLGTAASFRRRFVIPVERDGDADSAELLRRVTRPFVLRRLKSDRSIITDLPDKIEQTERVRLTVEQATLYRAVTEDILERTEAIDGIERRGAVLAGITKLKQVCNHPAHFLGDGSVLANRSGKLERVEQLVDEIVDSEDKVLCFTQYAQWGTMLADHFERRYGVRPCWLHGRTRRNKRQEMIERFSEVDGPQIFLLSLKAGGTGLNLTAASHVIHLDRWWNPAVEDQATDRAYRIGQRKSVVVHKLVSQGTIEERIDEMITAKRELAGQVVGSGEAWLTELSTEELHDVLELRDTELVD